MNAGPRPIVQPAEPLRDGPTVLRPWRDGDVGALAVLCRDPEIARFVRVPANYGPSDARAYLQSRFDRLHAGISAPFAIVQDDPDGRLLGSVSLLRFAWADRRAEVGYWVGAPARGAGHATRATRLICAWGVRALGLERVELLASTLNPGSQRVAEHAGFTREAVLRSWTQGVGERHDVVCFGLLPGELDAGN